MAYLVFTALALVLVLLVAGLAVTVRGGEAAGRWSNILMRWRVLAQGLALLVIVLTGLVFWR
jgi:hypothetical protein